MQTYQLGHRQHGATVFALITDYSLESTRRGAITDVQADSFAIPTNKTEMTIKLDPKRHLAL